MFFLAVYIHMFRSLYYDHTRSRSSWSGSWRHHLSANVVARFMRYVLVWGQMSFWAATVITNLFLAIPGVGDTIVTSLWGAMRLQPDAQPIFRFTTCCRF